MPFLLFVLGYCVIYLVVEASNGYYIIGGGLRFAPEVVAAFDILVNGIGEMGLVIASVASRYVLVAG